MIQAPDWRFS